MATNQIDREEFGRFLNKPYELACVLLDCEAFQSWHTPTRNEWCEVLTAIKTMVKQYDWPLYEVTSSGDTASAAHTVNTGLMLNALHQLLAEFHGHDMSSVPSPGQWGDIMRVVDETTERRALVDETGKSKR